MTTVDARGLSARYRSCSRRPRSRTRAGRAITVLATDPEAAIDLAAWAADAGHAFDGAAGERRLAELVLRKSSSA